jgi:hypothetical protein
MEKDNIINTAIENLHKNAGVQAHWEDLPGKKTDGKITVQVGKQTIKLYADVKQELRQHQVPLLEKMAAAHPPFMIVTKHIFPKIKEELRQKNIAYLEANGNIWLQQKGAVLWLEGQKPIIAEKGKSNRALTKTGLKVVFQFLINEQFVNMAYREIAGQTKVGLGNINYVMNGLKEMAFLIRLNKDQYQLINKKELLNKWMTAYTEKLKPALKIGTFRFLKEEDFINWKKLPLRKNKTWWGGEPAGDILTNYLRPAELTLYTTETRNELIKNYKLIPDEKGNVKAYKKFWQQDETNDIIVPPLLIYTDLVNTNDRRCMQTAQKIYDEFVQNKL